MHVRRLYASGIIARAIPEATTARISWKRQSAALVPSVRLGSGRGSVHGWTALAVAVAFRYAEHVAEQLLEQAAEIVVLEAELGSLRTEEAHHRARNATRRGLPAPPIPRPLLGAAHLAANQRRLDKYTGYQSDHEGGHA